MCSHLQFILSRGRSLVPWLALDPAHLDSAHLLCHCLQLREELGGAPDPTPLTPMPRLPLQSPCQRLPAVLVAEPGPKLGEELIPSPLLGESQSPLTLLCPAVSAALLRSFLRLPKVWVAGGTLGGGDRADEVGGACVGPSHCRVVTSSTRKHTCTSSGASSAASLTATGATSSMTMAGTLMTTFTSGAG